jgi:hypothetical protein
MQQSAGGFGALHRYLRWIEDAQLDQNAGMIPVQVLARDLGIFKFNNGYRSDLNLFSRWRDAWYEPVHNLIVSKLIDRLFNESIFSNNLRDGDWPNVSGELSKKVIAIEVPGAPCLLIEDEVMRNDVY